MTIDLSKAKRGDTVHFRCGGKAVINYLDQSDGCTCLRLDNTTIGFTWTNTGYWFFSGNEHPFDITRIEPAPFDWKDVKPGMAFFVEDITYPEPQLAYFVGYDIDGHVVFDTSQIDGDIEDENFVIADRDEKGITRAPKYDIQVQQ